MMLLFLLHCFEKVCQARLYGKGCVKKTMTDETKVVSNRGSIGWIGRSFGLVCDRVWLWHLLMFLMGMIMAWVRDVSTWVRESSGSRCCQSLGISELMERTISW